MLLGVYPDYMESERNYRIGFAILMVLTLTVLYFTIWRDHNGIAKVCNQTPRCEANYNAK